MLSPIKLEDGQKLDEREARRVVDAVRNSGGPQLALAQARDHASAARDQLKQLERSDATLALESLAGYVVSRKL